MERCLGRNATGLSEGGNGLCKPSYIALESFADKLLNPRHFRGVEGSVA